MSTKGEIKSTVVRCGLDLNSDDYEWIPSEQREFIHRNVLYQIDHFKIVEPKEAKSSDMGSMLIFYLKVIGGYSLVQKNIFMLNIYITTAVVNANILVLSANATN